MHSTRPYAKLIAVCLCRVIWQEIKDKVRLPMKTFHFGACRPLTRSPASPAATMLATLLAAFSVNIIADADSIALERAAHPAVPGHQDGVLRPGSIAQRCHK